MPEIDLAPATLLLTVTTSSGQIKGLVGVGSGVAAREAICTKAKVKIGRSRRCHAPAVAVTVAVFLHIETTATASAGTFGLTFVSNVTLKRSVWYFFVPFIFSCSRMFAKVDAYLAIFLMKILQILLRYSHGPSDVQS